MPSRTPTVERTRNPFADPASFSSAAPQPPAPPPPPKQHAHIYYKNAQTARPQLSTRGDSASAARETPARPADPPVRTRPSRSQTTAAPVQSSRPSAGQRSMTADSAPRPADKSKSRHHKSKKPASSMHADVIDRLDFSGVGPMFHHDGPFDACAPSRNRHKQKAPMYSWSAVNPEDEMAYREQEGRRLEPPRDVVVKARPVPFLNDYSDTPKRKDVDAIAEAWGIHEPEPFEDFSAGGSERHEANSLSRATYSKRERHRGDEPRAKVVRRSTIPPPQPIFTGADPLAQEDVYPPSPPPSGGANLGRSKSLMQRIRKMRDAPNVPVDTHESAPANGNGNGSPTSSDGGMRPAQRTQNFLGRFGKSGREEPSSPLSPDTYVYVPDPKMKDLPSPPPTSSPTAADRNGGYFDAQPGAGGVGRRGSLMRKMREVVGRK